ncbi:hypothetical protein D9758_007585 [Tetrapyrgos nigripes]|uniref:Major facilitator superfamily (MFS) profile domain-containing protein n=1 Tax=Tetrapyrgos nigripes TaxID=182062 RepID=A0A8H5LJZ2_9AGAR|nr:hypothetical protein D9758_007585 [Tetrapyrgos nigripes]
MSVEEEKTTTSEKSINGDVVLHQLEKGQDSQVDYSELERKTIRQIDLRMLPLLGILYAIALVDRTNLSFARTAGMEEDLQIAVGDRYSIVSLVFFIPYTLFELPSNLLLRRFGVRLCLTCYIAGWAVVLLGMTFVKNYQQLAVCRTLLGVFEAGFFPAMTFVISTWYKRHEVQARLVFFYMTSVTIGSCSPILCYCMTLLGGKAGLKGWQWIFLIQALVTFVLVVLTWFLVVDFPDKNTFLTPEQTQLVLDRLEKDRGDSLPDELTKAKVFHHLGDWIIWAHAADGIGIASSLEFWSSTFDPSSSLAAKPLKPPAIVSVADIICDSRFLLMAEQSRRDVKSSLVSAQLPATAASYFSTIILKSMGWSTSAALLLTTPPYFAAALVSIIIGYLSDRTKQRASFLAFQTTLTIIGLLVVGYASGNGVRYFGIFVLTIGSSGCVPAVLAYSANNVVSHSKRSVSTGVVIAFGGIGGIMGTTVFRQEDFPRYINGIWTSVGAQLLMLIVLAVTTWTYWRRNKLAREGKLPTLEGQPGFYYTL